MMPEDEVNSAGDSARAPHRMRITSAGSIPNYVRFATAFLLDNPSRPLVLHTLPPTSPSKAGQPSRRPSNFHPCTLNAPRLISVVEQIKRELTSPTSVKGKEKQKRQLRSLWQYTESRLLPVDEKDGDDGDPLARVLSGKTKPKMLHRPYLQITLSTQPLGLEQDQNVTCQVVLNKRYKAIVSRQGNMNDPADDKNRPTAQTDLHADKNPTDHRKPVSAGQKRKSWVGAEVAGAELPKKKKNKRKVMRVSDV